MTLREAIDCAVNVKRHRMEHWAVRVMGDDYRTTWRCKDCFFTITEVKQGPKVWPVAEPVRVCLKNPPKPVLDK